MTNRAAQLRAEALEAALEAAEQTIASPGADAPAALRRASERLRARLEELLERDADGVVTDATLQALVVRARSTHARVRAAEADLARRPSIAAASPAPASPERARATIDRLGLRACAACQSGDVLLVRDDLVLQAGEGAWPLSAVVCAACGDVRLRMRDPEARQRALRDPEWERIALPGGGPFRGG